MFFSIIAGLLFHSPEAHVEQTFEEIYVVFQRIEPDEEIRITAHLLAGSNLLWTLFGLLEVDELGCVSFSSSISEKAIAPQHWLLEFQHSTLFQSPRIPLSQVPGSY